MPTLREFVDIDFAPFAAWRLASKAAAFVAKRRKAGLAMTSINRQLEVLRRMLKLAVE